MSYSLNKEKLDSILRVDHAGETAAAKIYDGQLAILKKHSSWSNNPTYERPRARTFRHIQ
jgi:demethoxyubiquinone hydroxylase (CLK1/Coq7/Cat5 family)